MAMMVQGSDGIDDGALPVAELAASMRLADGYDTVPGQVERMRARLQAAIATVERRTGKALIARNFVLHGTAEAGSRVSVPVSPVSAVVSVAVQIGSATVDLGDASVEPHPHRSVVVLSQSVRSGARLTMTVTGGYGAWAQVPAPLAEAVLSLAEQLDRGEAAPEQVDGLIFPFRELRIGGRSR